MTLDTGYDAMRALVEIKQSVFFSAVPLSTFNSTLSIFNGRHYALWYHCRLPNSSNTNGLMDGSGQKSEFADQIEWWNWKWTRQTIIAELFKVRNVRREDSGSRKSAVVLCCTDMDYVHSGKRWILLDGSARFMRRVKIVNHFKMDSNNAILWTHWNRKTKL